MNETVLFEKMSLHGRFWAEITLNRPEKGNALTVEMLDELERLARQIAQDAEIRAVVLRGRGRFFCTGGDIEAWGGLSPNEMAEGWILRGIQVFHQIATLPQPVIAVLHGHTLGGGLELALAADIRIAAQPAKLGTPEVKLGMIAGWNGVRRLAEIVGVARARYMAITGSMITAGDALKWGLVTTVTETPEELETALQSLLVTLLENGPIAMSVTKGILETIHSDLRQMHASGVARVSATEDCKEGVLAFREKRKPAFQNS